MATLENGDVLEESDILTYAEAFPPLFTTSHIEQVPPVPVKSKSPWATQYTIPSSTVTQIFRVPIEERRYKSTESAFGSENQQAVVVRDIIAKTGCKIETSQSKDQSLTIMVTGRPSEVKEAHRLIKAELHTKTVLNVTIPKEHHRKVLGKQAANLKQIELNTGTRITIPRSDDRSDVIKITGNKEDIDMARHLIQSISDDMSKHAKEQLEIEHEYHPFISGPNGSNIGSIMERTGTRINMPPYSTEKTDITITGEKEGVAKAKAEVLQIYENVKRNCTTVSVEVRKSQHKYVVGQKGQGINDILSKTGVYVQVPSLTNDESTITLRGPQDKMGEALTLVYGKANSMVTEEVSAPSWLHRFIIGRKGENIKNITRELPRVTVTFPKEGDTITIEGPPDEVQLAQQSFENFTEGLMATMVYAEVSVPQKFHPHIIGKKGANVNKIKEETCTSISIPSDKDKSDVIRIEGDPQGVAAAKKIIVDLTNKLKNERSETLQIDQKWHKVIIGANGENMKELRDRYPGVHIAFPEPGRRSNIVTLRGPTDEVKKCSVYLQKSAEDIVESNYRFDVKISKKYYGSIIGKGGVTLRKIREETNTKIEMPKEDSELDIITITGKKENVDKARKRLQEIEKQVASIVDTVIRIPRKQHNVIIGPKGKLIRSIMDECGGVKIHFPSSDSESDEVHIHGPKEDVMKAKVMLLEIATKYTEENYTEEIKCKPEYHRFLIGRGGAKIRKVRDDFEARVIFPQKDSDDESDVIVIIGKKKNVVSAKDHLLQLIKDLDNIVQEEVTVALKYHRHFIQRRGQLIHEISEENGNVIISFPKSGSGSDKVLLKGAKQCIEGAKTAIEEIVEDLEAQVTIECVVPRKNHRDVMGPKGSNVQGITQEHNVTIKFPERDTMTAKKPTQTMNGKRDDDNINDDKKGEDQNKEEEEEVEEVIDPRDVILIMGRRENCEAAKKALEDLVPVKSFVNVPFEFHRYIIGTRGQDIRTMADKYGVSIEVPRSGLQEDTITLHGPIQNCESAKQALELRVQELEAEKEERELRSYKEVLNIDMKYHPNIIGKRGATINKIREEHDVRIQLPEKDHSHSQDIVIIGYEHQVHSAKEAILKIVRELEDQISEEVDIDHRVHSRLIGAKGKAIAKVMEKFSVVVRFPKVKSSDSVSITGLEENVEDAKEHLTMLAEDYMQDVIEKQEEEDLMNQYTRRPNQREKHETSPAHKGFVVAGAPWSVGSTEEFPAIGTTTSVLQKTPAWGPSSMGPKLPKTV